MSRMISCYLFETFTATGAIDAPNKRDVSFVDLDEIAAIQATRRLGNQGRCHIILRSDAGMDVLGIATDWAAKVEGKEPE